MSNLIYFIGDSFTLGYDIDTPDGIADTTYCDYVSNHFNMPYKKYAYNGASIQDIMLTITSIFNMCNNGDYVIVGSTSPTRLQIPIVIDEPNIHNDSVTSSMLPIGSKSTKGISAYDKNYNYFNQVKDIPSSVNKSLTHYWDNYNSVSAEYLIPYYKKWFDYWSSCFANNSIKFYVWDYNNWDLSNKQNLTSCNHWNEKGHVEFSKKLINHITYNTNYYLDY